MEIRNKNTHTRTLSCGSICAKLSLAVALFMPALIAFRGFPESGKARKVTEIVKIVEVVEKSDGNLSKAADTLGVHRNTLSRKIKELKIKTARP